MDILQKEISLAIIIPFYKNNFIEEALKSIEAQTNQNFKLYIGDDASPNEIKVFIEKLADDFKKKISYHRFDQNLGSISLTKQWERCIDLSKDENYIWLFSDDDVMPNDAVQRFYDTVDKKANTDLLRFNINIIDNNSKVMGGGTLHPRFETAESFAHRRMKGECISTACEYIFTRNIYETKNKFVEFPLAWASDDASWINFSKENGIQTIEGKPVLWRMSGVNISSSNGAYKSKIKAGLLYMDFLSKNFSFTNNEKFNWLIGQLNLLGNFKGAEKEFYKQLFKSKLFSKSFIIGEFFKIKVRNLVHKLNN